MSEGSFFLNRLRMFLASRGTFQTDAVDMGPRAAWVGMDRRKWMEVRVHLVALLRTRCCWTNPSSGPLRPPTRISSPIYTNSKHGTRIQF